MYDMLLWIFIVAYLDILGILFVRLAMTIARCRLHHRYTAAIEPPSVSVCIPARNEMHALSQCLERVLASDYPKLEIIVFDDESIDDTSIIIRSFAQAGVRFIPSISLPEGWLGKNHALDVLARQASGTFILFMDVDTFIQPATISQLVGFITSEKAEMASVIPRRNDIGRASVLFGTLRYFWQLVSIAKHHVPSSSSLWMIRRHTLLDDLGGFTPYKMIVEPETAMAVKLARGYHGLISNNELGVSYEKRWCSQVETARRLLYPYFGGTWYGGMAGLILLVFLNMPLLTIVVYGFLGWTTVASLAVFVLLLSMMLYGFYLSHIWQRSWWLGALLWPIVVLQELILLVSSIWGYAQKSITWKNRAVLR
jgi:glycosyltransferase involved in cell wall biosynthesis